MPMVITLIEAKEWECEQRFLKEVTGLAFIDNDSFLKSGAALFPESPHCPLHVIFNYISCPVSFSLFLLLEFPDT